MLRHANKSARRRLHGAALALCLAVAASASAAPAEIAVGSLDPQTGRFRVRESVLTKTFADGTPVGQFQIRYFSRLPFEIDAGFFLTRSADASAGTCRTEATRVTVHHDKAWIIEEFDLPKLVIDCGGPVPDCPSCQVRTGTDWSCGCFAGGEDTGRPCLSGLDTVLTQTWLNR